MTNTYLKNIKAWYSQKKQASSTRLPRLDEFEHGEDSKDEEFREDTDTVAAMPKQLEAPIITDLAPHFIGICWVQVSSSKGCCLKEGKDM